MHNCNIGNKLEYVFGKATGAAHNIARSKQMLLQLQRIGIFDNKAGRAYLSKHLNEVFQFVEGEVQANGRTLRESLLMGPNGALKMNSIWDGDKLITIELFGK